MNVLVNSLSTLISFIFVLGLMIFVHEFGHFIAAKWLKIRVDIFSLGFGTRLFGFRRGDTDYRVCLLPLGGYVKLAGENPDETISGSPDEFLTRPKYQRLLVYFAGPVMNILMAILFLAVNYMAGIEMPKYLKEQPVIGQAPPESPAAKSGLQSGDLVLSVDGRKMTTWRDLQIAVGSSPNRELDFMIRRGSQDLSYKITTVSLGRGEIGSAGLVPFLPQPVVDRVEPASPADKAGVRKGDAVLRVEREGQVAEEQYAQIALIYGSEDKELTVTLKRGEEIIKSAIVPVKMNVPSNPGYNGQGRIGVSFKIPSILERYGVWVSLTESVRRNYEITLLTFDLLGKLFTGKASLKVMSGPIDIAVYSGEAARMGPLALIGFIAMISLQLGVFNLLPIPVLDGGQIFLLLLEGLIRRDISLNVKEQIAKVGFVLLILLMSVVLFNDLSKHASSWWGKMFP
jgi:regulator of sigma E protease